MKVESLVLRVEGKKRALAVRSRLAISPGTQHSTLYTLPRRGMTLIELLVVIVILTTLVAAAIPLISPQNDDRRLREAARGLNTYITGAQTRAIATNRPYGVSFKRLSHDTTRPEDNGVSLEAFYVEQPPAYAGFDADSRVCVSIHPDPALNGYVLVRFVTRVPAGGTTSPGLPSGWMVDLFPKGMIRPHDVIEVNGTRYELLTAPAPLGNLYTSRTNVTLDNATSSFYESQNGSKPVQIVAVPLNNSGQQINSKYDDDGFTLGSGRESNATTKPPAPYWALPAPYKIYRQPTPASDEPYQMPEGTAIDLRASGVGLGDYFYWPGENDNSDSVTIMFAPEGRVQRVAFSQVPVTGSETETFDKPVVESIYLLIGRRENIPAPEAAVDPTLNLTEWNKAVTEEDRERLRKKNNWLMGGSRWLVIGAQSGRVVTLENAFVDVPGILRFPPTPFTTASPSTELMRAAQIVAAREFTREMKQVGGR